MYQICIRSPMRHVFLSIALLHSYNAFEIYFARIENDSGEKLLIFLFVIYSMNGFWARSPKQIRLKCWEHKTIFGWLKSEIWFLPKGSSKCMTVRAQRKRRSYRCPIGQQKIWRSLNTDCLERRHRYSFQMMTFHSSVAATAVYYSIRRTIYFVHCAAQQQHWITRNNLFECKRMNGRIWTERPGEEKKSAQLDLHILYVGEKKQPATEFSDMFE